MSELGRFITNGKDTPFYARRRIRLQKKVKSATAKVCGLGQFVFWINGKKVEDHELDPGWTDYRKSIQFVTFDVTNYLKEGENVIGAEVGNGWFILNTDHYTFTFPEFMPKNPNPYQPFSKELMLALKLEICYEDDEIEVIEADDSFKVKDHFIAQSNVYGSETMDGGKKEIGFSEPSFDDGTWEQAVYVSSEDLPKGKLVNQFQPAIKVIHRYEAKKCGEVKGREIYNLGQNISGMLQVKLRGKKGDVIHFYPAEKLDASGDIDQVMKGWTTLDTVITCILGEDGTEEFRSKFTYFAGQYFAVKKSSDDIEILEFYGDAISSAWDTVGEMKFSDYRYRRIYDLVEKSVEANMVSVHTDCPTIERFAWQEPNHLMAPSIMYMKNGNMLWRKFFSDMRDSQHTKDDFFYDHEHKKFFIGDGLIPSQCPCYIPNALPVPGMGSFYDIIPWGSALILGVKWHYLFYGDLFVVEENYEAAKKYLSYLETKINDDGFINHGLGDWGNPDNELARENIETAFLYADMIAVNEFAKLLGNQADACDYQKKANEIKEHYNDLLLKKGKNDEYYYRSFEHKDKDVTTLATLALPLYFKMVPNEAVEGVKKCFSRVLLEKKALASGEIGLPYIIQTARECGMNDVIADYILKEEHPSYYAFVKEGLTTLGEYWEENPRSHCHDMMGHIMEWFYNGIAGIRPIEPGFKKVLVEPYLPKNLDSFECKYESVNGSIFVNMKRVGDKVELKVSADEAIELEVSKKELEQGTHPRSIS